MNWNYVLIGVVAIAVLLVLGYLIERWGVFEDSRAATGAERVDRSANGPETRPRIPVRDKPRQLPTELKIISFCLIGICAIVAFYTYQFLKNGSPAEFQYTAQLQFAVIALIGVGTGVAYRGHKDSHVGEIHVINESKNGDVNSEHTILYEKSSAETTNGKMLIKELRDERLFGLFRRYKLVGHDRNLRSDRPLGDIITHEIHSDAVELEDGKWVMRTQGRITVDGGTNNPADYRYHPPVRLPYEKMVKQQEQMRKKDIRMDSLRAQLAEAHSQIGDLVRVLENGEYRQREELKDDLRDIKDLVGTSQEHVTVQQDRGQKRRQVNGQRDIPSRDNGTAGGEA
ncbi:hypothetical protein Htur_5034 (plasmid) [Haloterrigena turkmenica DSM 5511]|uniref:Uncharacterized protein n=1 Tax=Haloterrigena turkmenica (strain ATCC 51198 / DSM 5511 / JCM 9101 / NCIMB 13204 / VKM B-1734 / 4k) TaxID=543526 RepID=D2S3H5_HALTV|nr:hypothetical protein [Haloterrigena turkmenica]ADB63922.1 hypothetical protein Htur_5034 [Haloterrigena turkmenica DSM 5511]